MPNNLSRVAIITLACALAACANIDAQKDALGRVTVCCSSPSELKMNPLAIGTQPVTISEQSPAFDFPQGRSRFHGFDLVNAANAQAPRRVRVKALIVGPTNVYTAGKSWARYFHPAVTFFDAARKPLGTSVASLNPLPPDNCGPNFGCGAVSLEVVVPDGARSFAIHEPSELLGRTTEQIGLGKVGEQTIYAGGALLFVSGGTPGKRVIAVSTGELEVTAIP